MKSPLFRGSGGHHHGGDDSSDAKDKERTRKSESSRMENNLSSDYFTDEIDASTLQLLRTATDVLGLVLGHVKRLDLHTPVFNLGQQEMRALGNEGIV